MPYHGETMTQNNNAPFCHRKPDISYPCQWEYKVIGKDRAVLEEIILASCAPATPVITLSNVSSSGRYYSLNATLVVESEEMRNAIFNRIQQHREVKMVI